MDVAQHFAILMYPFGHAVEGRQRRQRLSRLQHRWHPWWQRLTDEGRQRVFSDTYFFLPYVRSLLYPETDKTFRGARDPSDLAQISTPQLAQTLNPSGVLRLTLAPDALGSFSDLTLCFERPGSAAFNAALHIDWVDALLFPQGVGFLALRITLTEPAPTVEYLRDTLALARQVLPTTAGWYMPHWRTTDGACFSSEDLVNFLLQGLPNGGLGAPIASPAAWAATPACQRQASAYSTTDFALVYGRAFRLYTYASLAGALADTPDSEPFGRYERRLLYELATCSNTALANNVPHAASLEQMLSLGHIALWNNWEGLALHDNVVFLATQPSTFTHGPLANNIGAEYLSLYVLALYQKIRLSLMSGESMREGRRDTIYRHLRAARIVWDNLVRFRNLYWLTEVTIRPQGSALYQRFRSGLGTNAIYEAVSTEVHELQGYYEHKAQRSVSFTLNLVAFIGLPFTVLFGIYGTNLFPEQPWPIFLIIVGLILGASSLIWMVSRYVTGRWG